MDSDKYIDEIQKSGFFLEFKVADSLKEKGWSVISNRYYIDDLTEAVREIDIVGYKTTKVKDFTVYTVLIISCKKSEKNLWALLSKDINWDDPNAEWRPMHVWSNHPALSYMITDTEWKEQYFEYATKNNVDCAMCLPEVDIFAFQEMNSVSGKIQNDKSIYNSITSLMKAQAYEFSSLPKRKKDKVIYQFNLISLVDSKLMRLHFKNNNIVANSVEQDIYITNYIIRKESTCVRIHFIHASKFLNILENYLSLHKSNCLYFGKLYEQFYADAVESWGKRSVYKKVFLDKIGWRVRRIIRKYGFQPKGDVDFIFGYEIEKKYLLIGLDVHEECIDQLNIDENLNETIALALKDLYKYSGAFKFEMKCDIPF